MSSIERDPLAGLTPRERQRLARFGAAFERLDAAQYSTLSDGGQGEVVRHAQAHALETIGHGPRHHGWTLLLQPIHTNGDENRPARLNSGSA